MKKLVTVILLMVTIAGTFIPCCLTDNCGAEQNVTSTSDHRSEGTCSPFFACSTCPGFVKLTKAIHIDEVSEVVLVHHEKIVKYAPSSFAASFWQPPRVG